MITGIGHIAITASDYETSIAFYRDTLGLPVAFRVDRDGHLRPDHRQGARRRSGWLNGHLAADDGVALASIDEDG